MAPSSIPDVFAARPVLVYGKYHGKPEGSIIITGYQGKKKFKQEFKVSSKNVSAKNKALRYLWARKKIEELDDYNKLFSDDVKQDVIDLGIKYNLVTNYTSFVAVDETIVNEDGTLKTIKQPLAMPKNVNNSAVGAEAEVSKKTTFKKSFSITINENLLKIDKRKIKMEFKALYTTLVTKYLKQYDSLRIKFNAEGEITEIEVLDHGTWVYASSVFKEFTGLSVKTLDVNRSITLTLKR